MKTKLWLQSSGMWCCVVQQMGTCLSVLHHIPKDHNLNTTKPRFYFPVPYAFCNFAHLVRSQPNPQKNKVSDILHFPKFYANFCGLHKALNQGFIAHHSKNIKCQTKFKIRPHGTKTGSYLPYSANLPWINFGLLTLKPIFLLSVTTIAQLLIF